MGTSVWLDRTIDLTRKWFRRISVALALVLLLGITPGLTRTASAADSTVRVLAVDGDTGDLTVLDGADGAVLGRFSTPGGGFVPDPGSGEIVAVNAATGEITGRFAIGGRPARVAAVSASGVQHE